MKVYEVMKKEVVYVDENTSVKEVCRIIFGRGINGVPVLRERKVIGFISERDILAAFLPSIEEYMDDPINSVNFEEREKELSYIFQLLVKDVMDDNPVVIQEGMPLLRAQSLMLAKKISRLPVIDAKGRLSGIISKGDIFGAIVGSSMLIAKEESFYDWQASYYDSFMDWEKRLSSEIPDLVKKLRSFNVKRIIDVASSTGEHSIALAKQGFEVIGLESSKSMLKLARKKLEGLPLNIQKRVNFIEGYSSLNDRAFDAAIFMGNTLPHIYRDKDLLKTIIDNLRRDNAVLIFQITNFQKLLKPQGGIRDFIIRELGSGYKNKYSFLSFYTKIDRNKLIYTKVIFNSDGKSWKFRSMNNTEIAYVNKEVIESILKKIGFSKLSLYGGTSNGRLFTSVFDPLKSDWLNVVAVK